MKSKATIILAILFAISQSGTPSGQQSPDQWPNYQHNSNFSPLTAITPENVKNLVPAWTFNYGAGSSPAGSLGLDYRFEVQPLLIGGVMYFSTPASPSDPNFKSTITALEPETGKVVWQYTTPQRVHGRGLAHWPGNGKVGPRLYFGMDQGYLMAVDMKTGQPAEGFGTNGQIDVYIGVASKEVGESRRSTFTIPNPVSVYKNLIIAGARPGEVGPPQPRGDIRAWDAITGKQVWEFHVIPQSGEANYGTWPSTDVSRSQRRQHVVDDDGRRAAQPDLRRPRRRESPGTRRQEPLHGFAGRHRCHDRQDEVVPPVDSSRHLGLRHGDAAAARRRAAQRHGRFPPCS